jgi:hypothetical protein
MKLGELLIERGELQKRIAQMAARLTEFSIVQEGDVPPFDTVKMLAKLDRSHIKLEEIINKINSINSRTELESGLTLAEAVAKREVMKSRRNIYNGLLLATMLKDSRYSKKEIRFVSTLDSDHIFNVTDDLAKEIRILDSKIQLKNWEVEIT